MNKHTPGPWQECGHGRGGCACGLIFAPTADLFVADVSLDDDEETRENRPDEAARKANARLIAAAPELLKSLEGAVIQMDMAGDCIEAGRIDEALLHVRSMTRVHHAAIAKARGSV